MIGVIWADHKDYEQFKLRRKGNAVEFTGKIIIIKSKNDSSQP